MSILKERWGKGPWQDEPDRLEWNDQETGLHCLIVRAGVSGALCGYVGIGPTHPAHGLNYNGVPYEEAKAYQKATHESMRSDHKFERIKSPKPIPGVGEALDSIEVHGGLTFAGLRNEFVRNSGLWYFGFDCSHAWDLLPGLDATMKLLYVDESVKWKEHQEMYGDWKYRDINYVKAECQRLARQLKAMDNVKVPTFTSGSEKRD
jgi:hypothetical protein